MPVDVFGKKRLRAGKNLSRCAFCLSGHCRRRNILSSLRKGNAQKKRVADHKLQLVCQQIVDVLADDVGEVFAICGVVDGSVSVSGVVLADAPDDDLVEAVELPTEVSYVLLALPFVAADEAGIRRLELKRTPPERVVAPLLEKQMVALQVATLARKNPAAVGSDTVANAMFAANMALVLALYHLGYLNDAVACEYLDVDSSQLPIVYDDWFNSL